MKFNLKNRPEIKTRIPCLTDFVRHDQKMDEWFEGFEKELREIFAYIDLIAKQHGGKTIRNSAKYDLIKEILGE